MGWHCAGPCFFWGGKDSGNNVKKLRPSEKPTPPLVKVMQRAALQKTTLPLLTKTQKFTTFAPERAARAPPLSMYCEPPARTSPCQCCYSKRRYHRRQGQGMALARSTLEGRNSGTSHAFNKQQGGSIKAQSSRRQHHGTSPRQGSIKAITLAVVYAAALRRPPQDQEIKNSLTLPTRPQPAESCPVGVGSAAV